MCKLLFVHMTLQRVRNDIVSQHVRVVLVAWSHSSARVTRNSKHVRGNGRRQKMNKRQHCHLRTRGIAAGISDSLGVAQQLTKPFRKSVGPVVVETVIGTK